MSQCYPPLYIGREGQALGQESEEAGVGGGVGRVGDLHRRFHDLRLLNESAHPGNTQVGHQCGSDQRLALAAPPRQFGPLAQVGLSPWITRSKLCMAESYVEIGALCVGSVQRLGRIQRDLVVVRRLRRSEVLEGVIAGGDRPVECLFGQAGQRTMPGQL